MDGVVTENNMADTNASMLGTLSPEDYAQQQQISRQQRFADMLMAQNQQPQGQMVSGRYVAPSFFQMLNPVANVLAGAYIGKEGDTKAVQLAQKLRTQEMLDLENYQKLYHGTPAVEGGIAGPSGMTKETTADMYGPNMELNAPYKQVAPVAAQQGNPMAANLAAASSYSPALRALGMKKLTEGPNWAEVSQINPKTGNTETYVYDKNSADPRSTMRFVSVSKPALTASEMLHLNDQGIGTGGYGGPSSAIAPVNGTMPAAGGNVSTVSGNAPVGGTVPVGNRPVVSNTTVKPVSATTVPEDALVKTYGYDPFKPPPMPAMPSGSAARAYKADLYKPLEGTPANTVTGATTYVDALGKYNEYISGLNAKDLASPQVRNRLNSLYAQVKLTGKEANNLGVLNGGDERILEEVVPNYSNILVTKKTVQKILDEQKEFGSSKIVATYRTAQKPVPENMRKYIVVPKVEETPTGTPKQTGATARAVLNGQPIEVRNGKWVNSNTGEEVK
jgi:hypothetical protein